MKKPLYSYKRKQNNVIEISYHPRIDILLSGGSSFIIEKYRKGIKAIHK